VTLTAIFCTGWEHGVAAIVTTGGGLSSAITGTPTSDAAAARSGSYGLLINPSAAGEQVVYNTATTGIRKTAARFYVRFTSFPAGDTDMWAPRTSAPAQMAFLIYQPSSGKIAVQCNGGTATAIGPVLSTNTWYRIDVQFDSSGTTWTMRGTVDGGTEGSATLGGQAATDQRSWSVALSGSATYTAHYDDLIFGTYTVDSEYWGQGQVVALKPTGDGTHNASTVIEDNAGVDITSPNAFPLLDEIPISDTANYIQQSASGTGNYAEVTFADLPASAGKVNAARAVLMYGSSTTTANTGGTVIRRNDNTTDVVQVGSTTTTTDINQNTTLATARWDMSDTAPFYKGCLVPATADGTDFSSLSPAIVNDLRGRVGYSNDASPLPRWYSLMLEVDYAVVSLPAPRKDRAAASRSFDDWSTTGWQ
jgi:hypothetical protein